MARVTLPLNLFMLAARAFLTALRGREVLAARQRDERIRTHSPKW